MAAAPVAGAIRGLYRQLLGAYGPQGWWPVPSQGGYHPGDYDTPRAPAARFEVIMGAVLTQNTAWTNAAAALESLRAARVRLPSALLGLSHARLARLIRSSGYFNEKAKKLLVTAGFFSRRGALGRAAAPSREALLALWGIGPETADSILLYAFQEPVFVVDAYTRRVLDRIGLIEGQESYDEIQRIFHAAIRPNAPVYNEYHALIVEHAKRHCASRPRCEGCPVKRCRYRDGPPAGRP